MIRRGFERRNRENEDFGYVITNNDVLQICKTEYVISHVEKQQSKYLAHIARRKNRNNAKRLLCNDDKNYKRGRPMKTLEQHVLQNSNTTADEFYHRALRRNTDMVGNRRNRSMSTTVDGS